jgi:GMP synthase-like glutamine amidotransferase
MASPFVHCAGRDITALGKVEASSQTPDGSAEFAGSPDATKAWRPEHGAGEYWWRIDFGAAQPVTAIHVAKASGEDGRALDYWWEHSPDGSTWSIIPATRRTNCVYREPNFSFSPIAARFFRLRISRWTGTAPVIERIALFRDARFERPPVVFVDNLEGPVNTGSLGVCETLAAIGQVSVLMLHRSQLTREALLRLGAEPVALFLSGGNREWDTRNFDEYRVEFDLINEGRYPVLGMCSGHQTIAIAAAGRNVVRHMVDNPTRPSSGENGYLEIEKLEDDPVLEGLPGRFKVQLGHHDEVVFVPPGYKLLAQGTTCRVQMIRRLDAPVYGVQFHPWLVEAGAPAGHIILRNFINLALQRAGYTPVRG